MNKLLNCALAGALCTFSVNASASNSTFTDLNWADGSWSVANSINNSNQIAVTQNGLGPNGYGGFNITYRSAILENSSITYAPLNYVQYPSYSYSVSINEAGQVYLAGRIDNKFSEFLWDTTNNTIAPKLQIPPVDPVDGFIAHGSNSLGQVTGSAEFANFTQPHAAIKDGDTLIDLGTLGGDISYGSRISDSGFVIGGSQLANGTHASFLWDGNSMGKLQFLEGINSITPLEVNNLGQSVGFSTSITNNYVHATLWNGTQAIDLNNFIPQELADAGWILKSANDINDHGWIVGEMYNTETRGRHGFKISTEDVISPVPEPTTWAMLLAGLGFLGAVGRKKVSLN